MIEIDTKEAITVVSRLALLPVLAISIAMAMVTVVNLAACRVAEMPFPVAVSEIKVVVAHDHKTPEALQKRMLGDCILEDTAILSEEATLTLIVDESPMYTWDITGNPNSDLLSGAGSTVIFEHGTTDCVNVITKFPICQGDHYFEFLMHTIGDEQWCGVTASRERAGQGGSVAGCYYYCGRRFASRGALHVPHEHHKFAPFQKVVDGDVIGVRVDVDDGILAFFWNGVAQGTCLVPKRPLYLATSLDLEHDRVELRKVSVEDAPMDWAAVKACDLPMGTWSQ